MAYATRSDVEAAFGKATVKKWADTDGNLTPDEVEARITSALIEAESDIDGYLRGGPYAVPFLVVPVPIKNMTARLAGYYLSRTRGTTEDEEGNQPGMTHHHKFVMNRIREIMGGRFRLEAEALVSYFPKVVDLDADD